MKEAIAETSSSGTKGLETWAFIPALKASRLSLSKVLAVRAIIGICDTSPSRARMAAAAS